MVKKKHKEHKKESFWKTMTIINLVILIVLAVFFLVNNQLKQQDYFEDDWDDFDEDELLRQGYEEIDDGFYGKTIGETEEERGEITVEEALKELYSGEDLEVAKKIIKHEEFQEQTPIKIKKLEGEELQELKKENPNIYEETKQGDYEVRFPSYFALYNYEEDKIIKWYHFQTINI